MKINRIWETLVYFEVIPFVNCIQKLLGNRQKTREYYWENMQKILITDTENNLTKTLIDTLLKQNYQIKLLTKNSLKKSEIVNNNVEIIPTDINLTENLDNQIWVGVNTIILSNQEGMNNLIAIAKQKLKKGEKTLFDFTQTSSELRETWGAVDDVVMGGISESRIQIGQNKAIFSGIVSTENNGGFASVRTKNFNSPWDLSAYEGIQIRVQGDGKRYKFITRCEGKWDGIGYCYSFDTLNNCWTNINIPFKDLIPVFRAKTVKDAGKFDSSKVYSMQLMLSKFEYDGGYNPKFQSGAFALEIESIKVYGGKNIPQLIFLSNGENENIVTNSGLNYVIIKLEKEPINETIIAQKCLEIINNN